MPAKKHLNTLFVTLDGTYLQKDGAAVAVKFEKETKLRVPLHNLDGIVTFGWDIGCSPQLMAGCAESGVSLSFLNPYGKFMAAVTGKQCGNVLLRREQYRRADDEAASVTIARNMIAAKLVNCRTVLRRAVRDHYADEGESKLTVAVTYFTNRIAAVQRAAVLDSVRGIEGDAGATYFEVFPKLLTGHDTKIAIKGRTKRPPLDPVNALLSFLYAILGHDCRSACEACGLDPQVGFLHRDRPGRASLALDLMEELRPVIADRVALTLLNRKQVTAKDFISKETGGVEMKEDARKTVLAAYQERKQSEILHPFLQEKTTLGLVPHLQARLLARHLRGDLNGYPAFLWK
ncbi:MAG: type I-C CRISPR-associated endonuclease Cas1c [Verrucomicrobiales bacterium]